MPHVLTPSSDGTNNIALLLTPDWQNNTIRLTLDQNTQPLPYTLPVTFDEIRVTGLLKDWQVKSDGFTPTQITGASIPTLSLKPASSCTLDAATSSFSLPFGVIGTDESQVSFTLFQNGSAVSQDASIYIHAKSGVSTSPIITIQIRSPSLLVLGASASGFQNTLTCSLRPTTGTKFTLTKAEIIAQGQDGSPISAEVMAQYFKTTSIQIGSSSFALPTSGVFTESQTLPSTETTISITGLVLPASPDATAESVQLRLTLNTPSSSQILSVYFPTCGPLTITAALKTDDPTAKNYVMDSAQVFRCAAPHCKPPVTWSLQSANGSIPDSLHARFNAGGKQDSTDTSLSPGDNTRDWLTAAGRTVVSATITLHQITKDTPAPVDLSGLDLSDLNNYPDPGSNPLLNKWDNFLSANGGGAKFNGATLTNLILCNKTLTSADFTGADLCGVDLSQSKIVLAVFNSTKLDSNTKLVGVQAAYGTSDKPSGLLGPGFTNCDLSQITLANCKDMSLVIKDGGGNQWPAFMSFASLDKADPTKKIAMFAGMKIGDCPLAGVSFAGLDLSGIDFTGVNLSDCDFTGATLNNVTIKNTTFSTDTKFTNATATNVSITNCNLSALTAANCQGLQLSLSDGGNNQFPAFWRLATSKANSASKFAIFPGAKLLGLPLTNTCFANLNLATGSVACDFTGLDLTGCEFTNAVIAGVNFTRANLSGADLTNCMFLQDGSTPPFFNNTTFSAATKLNNVVAAVGTTDLASGLVGPSFTNCDLRLITLANRKGMTLVIKDGGGNQWPPFMQFANLDKADLTKKIAMFAGMKIGGCPLAGVSFAGLDLSGIDFTGVNLTDCVFDDCNLQETNFSGATLTGVDFGDTVLGRTLFSSKTVMPASYPNLAYAIEKRASQSSPATPFALSGGVSFKYDAAQHEFSMGIKDWRTGTYCIPEDFCARDGLPAVVGGFNVWWQD